LDGAAWQACLVRAAGRIETINMNESVSDTFMQMAEHFKLAFENGLIHLSQRHFPVSQPDQRSWNE
jgi:hypothetical protein